MTRSKNSCWQWMSVLLTFWVAASARATDRLVATDERLRDALRTAMPGDRILLAPGVYSGGIYAEGLSGVTLTSQDRANPAVLDAGGDGEVLHLSFATDVTIEHLVFQNYGANGINIDDGGDWPAGASRNITLRNITVRNDSPPAGNRDGIKLSGVDDFLIQGVEVTNWGTGGSAIDPVGVHHGIIENSIFTHDSLSGGSGVRPKGGSKDLQIRANLLQLNAGRAIQAGGSTDSQFFRFVPGETGYEADDITVAGNLILGGESAVSWVNIDGGDFRFNYIESPSRWVMRMLNENPGSAIVDTQTGEFSDNIVVYGDELGRISNHDGPEVLEETFHFARNQWFNCDGGGPSGGGELELPSPEADGTYGSDPQVDPSSAVAFDMPWGVWIVNPHEASSTMTLRDSARLHLADAQDGGQFDPLAEDPFDGEWTFSPLTQAQIPVAGRSQVLLAWESFASLPLAGDYNASDAVEQADLDLVLLYWGTDAANRPSEWINHLPTGIVDQDELDPVLLNWGAGGTVAATTALVPEPSTIFLGLAAIGPLAWRARHLWRPQ